MRLTRTAALAGLASLALAGAGWAAGKPLKSEAPAAPGANVMTVALPGGGIATSRYSGDVAPRVIVGRTAADTRAARAGMDRMMAAMAYRAALLRERIRLTMAALEAQARSGPRDRSGPTWVSLPGFGTAAGVALPPGAGSYSSVTRVSGGRACTESVQVTRSSADAAPQVVRRTSGDCGAGAATPAAPRAAPARTQRPAVRPDRII